MWRAMPEGTVMGFDFGSVRIGVAIGETVTGLAHPLTGEWLSFDAALPDDLAGVWKQVTQG